MRRFLLLSSVVFLFCVQPRAFGQLTPVALNTKIQLATDSLYTMASLWGTTFVELYNGSQKYEELTPLRTDLAEFLDGAITEFKGIADVGGSEKLRASLIALFEFEKQLVQKGFQPFEQLNSNSSDAQVNACRQRLKDESVSEKSLLSNLNAERREFADKNNFPVVPPPEPKPVIHRKPTTARPVVRQPTAKQAEPVKEVPPARGVPTPKKTAKDESDDKDEE